MDGTNKRILAVFAHPDDETTTSGGTMARYAAEGAKVFVATVTRGEQGSLGSGEYEVVREDLPAVREAEIRLVLQALGVEPPIFLDYRDQEVPSADFEKLVTEVETIIDRIKPDVVITWGPTGISSHDDHIAVHRATVEAFHRYRPTAAKEPVLYFVAITDEVAKMFESEGFDFEVHESERTPTVVINISEHKSLKVRALRMYRSSAGRAGCGRHVRGRAVRLRGLPPGLSGCPTRRGRGRLLGIGYDCRAANQAERIGGARSR